MGELLSRGIRYAIERKKAEETLRESEKRFKDISMSIADWIWEVDEKGRYTFASGRVEPVLGYEPEEIIGKKPFDFMPEAEAQRIGEIFKNISAKKEPIFDLENWNLTKNGNRICFLTNGVPLLDKKGRLKGYRGVDRDITERKRTEEKYRKMQNLESLGVLAGGIAHEFNNFLTGILGNISLAKSRIAGDGELYRILSDSEEASRKAEDLTLRLLTFSKGGLPVKELTDISGLLRNSDILTLSDTNTKVELKLQDNLWNVKVDKSQIRQTIINIVKNAEEAMPKGGTIRVLAENVLIERSGFLPVDEGEYVKIAIEDEGVGISKDNLDKIFNPFFTTERGKSGLGLSIAFSIIKNHNGYISVDSEIKKGTVVTIFFPKGESGSKEKFKASSGKVRILLVEDKKIVRKTCRRMLERFGCEVVIVKDGKETVRRYKEALNADKRFDIVILDLTVPGKIGGERTIKELKRIDPDVKAIVTSGYSDDPVIDDFESYGFEGVIKKPYECEELARALGKVVGREDNLENLCK
jgi:two-component system cell cycle sensor histidine kinase/response regulator CckA